MTSGRDRIIAAALASEMAVAAWMTWGPRKDCLVALGDWWNADGSLEFGFSEPAGTSTKDFATMEASLEEFEDQGGRTIPYWDLAYPPQLRAVDLAPLVLHVIGNGNLPRSAIGIVGTRTPSNALHALVSSTASNFAEMRIPIITGLARGVDTAAATSAAANAGSVVGVSPCHPARSTTAAASAAHRDALRTGVVISETLWGTASMKGSYLRRNRIISGLSRLIIGYGIKASGGTYNQLQWASRQGRPFLVAAEGTPEGFRKQVPQSTAAYHFLQGNRIPERVQGLWVAPTVSPQTTLGSVPSS